MIKTNKENLVMQSVGGKVHSPIISSPYRISRDGKPMILPATGFLQCKSGRFMYEMGRRPCGARS